MAFQRPPGPPPGPPPSAFAHGPPGPPPGAPPGFPVHQGYPPPLPAGWSEHLAPDGVTPYYYNSNNRQSSYTRPVPQFRPPGIAAPAAAATKKKEKPKEKVLIPGTGWQRITTTQGNVFYFEKATKRSEWSVPVEIRDAVQAYDASEKQRKEQEAAEAAAKEKAARETAALEKLKRQERARLEVEEERRRKKESLAAKDSKRKEREGSEDEPAAKQLKTELQEGDIVEQAGPENPEDEEAWMKAIAAEFADEDQAAKDAKKAAKEAKKKAEKDALQAVFAANSKVDVSVDEQKALFKGLLYEKDISPFSPWETSLPLFINDPRYILLTNLNHRQEVFEEYCREVARARRQGKPTPGQAKKVDPEKEYKALLREQVTSTRTRWEDFKRKWKKDRRFWSWGRDDREREKAFKTHLRELGERKRADAKRAEADFLELLQETEDITPESEWADVKKRIASDSRYDPVGSSSLREELFKSFRGKIASSSAPTEDPAAKRAREKKEREAASLREREAKVRDEQFKVTMDVNKSRAGAGKEEAERLFGSLLVDAVRDDVQWADVVDSLQADPRFHHPSLTQNDKLRLFSDHLARIGDKRQSALNQLFAANCPKLDTTYEEVYPKIVDDFAVKRLGLEGDALEERFRVWKRGQEAQARQDFDAMLGESAFVDFWGRMRKAKLDEGALAVAEDEREEGEGAGDGGAASLVDMAKHIDLKEIHSVLRRDARYRAFDHEPELRERWLKEYLTNLEASNLTVHNLGPAQ